MNSDRQAEREQVAREWLIARGWCHLDASYQRVPVQGDVVTLADLLAAREAKVLEEAAALIEESMRPGSRFAMREAIIDYLRQQAQERRP